MNYAITAEQCRAARGLLNWSRDELSNASDVPVRTIADFELNNTASRTSTLARIRDAFEKSSIEFIDENGGGVGVRLATRKPRPGKYEDQG